MGTNYEVVNAPKWASMTAYDCAECGHAELGKPVFLTCNGKVAAYGSGCAAKLVYGRKDAKTVRLVKATFDLAVHEAKVAEELAAERRTAYTTAVASLEAGNDSCPCLQRARMTWKGRGPGFVAWIKTVAATGELGLS